MTADRTHSFNFNMTHLQTYLWVSKYTVTNWLIKVYFEWL